jgi:DHA1 family quinolone resistance protein-like MFS transporter
VKAYAIYFLASCALSASAIFTPIYARDLGATDLVIGYIGMAYGLSVFVAVIYFGRQADVRGRRRFLIVGMAASSLLASLQLFALDPFALMASRFALGFAAGMFPGALIAYAHDQGKKMGRFAAWGSLGFGTGNLLISFCALATWLYGALLLHERVYFTSAVILAAAFGIALTLPSVPRTDVKVPAFPLNVIKRNRDVYFSFLIRHTGANAVWIIFPLFVLELSPRTASGDFDYTWLGIIYAANSLTQGVIMQFLDKFEGRALVVAGEVLTLATFVGFYFSSNHIDLLLWSFVLAASWSTLYVGSLKTILARSPEKATASGLLTSTTSLAAMLGPLLGGVVSHYLGGFRSTIAFAAVMTVVALVAFKLLNESVERAYGPPPAPEHAEGAQ